jgi:long-subunit fatty acid transport protein
MSRIVFTAVLLCVIHQAGAQNEVDALRYSYNQTPYSARSMGMGGAFGALGADVSSFFNNPAGLAVYRRDGIEIGLGVVADNSRAQYGGATSEDEFDRFYLQSVGLINVGKPKDEDWSFSIGIGHTKLNSFNQNQLIQGTVRDGTMLDAFAAMANGIPYNDVASTLPFNAGLAWETFLIDPLDPDNLTYTAVAGSGRVSQYKNIERRGFSSETTVGGGMAYKEFLYLGASIGFNTINYSEKSVYREYFDETNTVDNFIFSEDLTTSGIGINFKLGAIVKATDWLRAGAFYQSPTTIRLSDSYYTSIDPTFRNAVGEVWNSPTNDFNFSVRTPGRTGINLAFILGDMGVIAADYEFSDFSGMSLAAIQSSDYGFDLENETIKRIYRVAHRFRSGIEFRMARYFRVRAGAAYEQSPFVNGVNENTPRINFTGGAGYRKDAFSIDLGIAYAQQTVQNWLYDPQLVSPADIQLTRLNVALALGIRF